MPRRPLDQIVSTDQLPYQETRPLSPAIYPTSVWICDDTAQADQLLGGQRAGYVYQRDGHPNADHFAEKCKILHAAEQVAVTASGMSALALAILSQLETGDHVLVGHQLYGKSAQLLTEESSRLGIAHTSVDMTDLAAVELAMRPETKLVVAETISNPKLQVVDIGALADLAHRRGGRLLIDNTFATPALCRPLTLGADMVLESVSKLMNGHSDVMLGLLCGRQVDWERVPQVLSAWGFASSPFDCWLAARGLTTMHLRVTQACNNAVEAAHWLQRQENVLQVDYPGIRDHPQHQLAIKQFGGRLFGTVVTFTLAGGRPAADRFIAHARNIPFCPSLGEVCTTLSHPESTSHRGLSPAARSVLGIDGGTLRLSLGIESTEFVQEALEEALLS